ncbi:MAG: TetR/AcrR family transcriptional regulator [Alphaproteobacteria bacterium]|nr:TetR/AcrR family transcriptional regulator [Alphaproteobacteria bacterium]MCB9699262.1 TetR/AcrR family transcriptional regulator [Alphaproteobacteria bacterium]
MARKLAQRESYHHGNLRRALMDAALRLVADGGPDAFSMAEAAREAGVSSGAPYRHFPDRRALLRAVADEAQDLLDQRLEAGVAEAGPDAWDRLVALGDAQVSFALSHPAHYRVLCSPEYRDPDDEATASEVETNRARMSTSATSREHATSFAAQCAIYGLARMVVDGQLGPDLDADEVSRALRAVLLSFRGRA